MEEWWAEAPKIVIKPPGPKASRICERNEKFVSGLAVGIGKILKIVYEEARGAVIKDIDGNLYIDFTSSITACNTGHSHPKVVEAIKRQADRFIHAYEYPTDLKADVAEKLSKIAPGNFEKTVIFSNCGTESVENAMRIAELYKRKHEMISFWESFHGKTRGSSSLTTYGVKVREGLTKLPGIYHIPYPDCNHCVFHREYPDCGVQCLEFLDHVINFESTGNVGAVILEPILGGGCVVPPADYWSRVKELCQQKDLLFIDDEVQAGMGRTGKMFAIEHYGVEPDILTTGKGLASALPIGSTISRKEITESLVKDYGGLFTSTFGSNAIPLAAASATIDVMIEEKLPENAAKIGEFILKRLNEMKAEHEKIGHIQGKGLLIGLEFVEDQKSHKPSKQMALEICKRCFENGLLIFSTGWQGNFVKINPPLVITQEQADKGLDVLDNVISEIERGH